MKDEEFVTKYCAKLSGQQLAGMRGRDGAVLLLAVPGSGKTTVLIRRLGYLVLVKNIAPEKLLTVTYTVAATRDMQRRFAETFGEELAQELEFRTINGICAKIIKRYGEMVGKPAFSLITDERVTAKVITDALAAGLPEYPTESDIKTARTLITYCKNMMLSEEEIRKVGEKERFPLLPVFKAYNEFLRANSLMDYDDQMRYAHTMLCRFPELLAQYRERYRYLLVDEAQDTSKIQHEIIGLLAGNGGNLFMVGDEDQSIYGFRAAWPEALLNFEKRYPGAEVLVMDRNYRSSAEIVALAERFIRHNRERHDKGMTADRGPGSQVHFLNVRTRQAQYPYLLKVAGECERQTAVLYRDNESALPLIDLLERYGIPYRVRNGEFSFFTSRVVADVTNMLRFALDPYDRELFLKIYYKCRTYLKKEQAMNLCRISEFNARPVLECAEELSGVSEKTLGNLRTVERHFRDMLEESPAKALHRMESALGYGEYMERNGMDQGKLFLLKVLARQESTVLGFLNRLEDLQTMLLNREEDGSRCPFLLSTIHSSKGLEYDRVYLMDVLDGALPGGNLSKAQIGSREEKNLEEERRLFYVGMTRAINELYIFSCDDQPSRFIRELKREPAVKYRVAGSRRGSAGPSKGSAGSKRGSAGLPLS